MTLTYTQGMVSPILAIPVGYYGARQQSPLSWVLVGLTVLLLGWPIVYEYTVGFELPGLLA